MKDNYILFSRLARKLEKKWLAENKLPAQFDIYWKGRTISTTGLLGPFRTVARSNLFNGVVYIESFDKKEFRYINRSAPIGQRYIGPIISIREVASELWSELSEEIKTIMMAEILGSKND